MSSEIAPRLVVSDDGGPTMDNNFNQQPPGDRQAWRIVKTGHSRNPWRIVDWDGTPVILGVEVVDLQSGPTVLPVLGHPSRRALVDALLTWAAGAAVALPPEQCP